MDAANNDVMAELNAIMKMVALAQATAGAPGGRCNKAAAEIASGRFIAMHGAAVRSALTAKEARHD